MLSVITLMDLITAHVALDTLEMEHHALVNHKLYPVAPLSYRYGKI